jgi:hypothetical protein
LQAVAYLNGSYLAGGDLGTLLTSLDGQEWTPLDSTTISHVNGFGFGAGLWVALGPRGQIITSGDGLSWTPRWSGVAAHLQSVAWGNGRFVAVGGAASPSARAILTSTNGVQWVVRELSPERPALWKVLFHEGQFIAGGNRGSLLVSSDGALWRSITNVGGDRISPKRKKYWIS